MSKYMAAFLVVAGLVSGQDYSLPGSTTEASDTTTSTAAIPSVASSSSTLSAAPESFTSAPTSALTAAPGSSTIDASNSSYTVETFFACRPTTPTLSATGPFVTIYNTIYIDVNLTGGLTQVTYTITDTCGCQHETDYTRPTGCPSGFTTTEKTCTLCLGSPVITCTTPIALPSETSNLTTAPAASTQGPNPQYSQSSQYTKPGSTPSSAPVTKPSYLTTNDAKPAAGSSPLGIITAMSMAVVAGLMCIL